MARCGGLNLVLRIFVPSAISFSYSRDFCSGTGETQVKICRQSQWNGLWEARKGSDYLKSLQNHCTIRVPAGAGRSFWLSPNLISHGFVAHAHYPFIGGNGELKSLRTAMPCITRIQRSFSMPPRTVSRPLMRMSPVPRSRGIVQQPVLRVQPEYYLAGPCLRNFMSRIPAGTPQQRQHCLYRCAVL